MKHALKAHFLTRAAARGRRVTHKERAGSRITSHVADRGQGYTRSDRFVRTKSITRPAQPKRTPKKRNARPTPRPRPAPLFLSFSRCRWLRLQLTRASGVRKQKNRNHHRKSPNPLSWHHYHGVKWCNGTREKQRWCGIWHRWWCDMRHFSPFSGMGRLLTPTTARSPAHSVVVIENQAEVGQKGIKMQDRSVEF